MSKQIKIATFNVEWMVSLFKNSKPQLLTRASKGTPGLGAKPTNPQGVADRIAAVISDIDADIIGICEGPPYRSQMQTFVNEKLAGNYEVYSMEDGSQSVHTLVHKRIKRSLSITQLPASDSVFERLRKPKSYFRFGSVRKAKTARFTRLPVILRIKHKGKLTEVMTMHTKSKISDLKNVSDWKGKKAAKIISAINSRQKLSIEMNVIRKYIAHRLYSEAADSVIVMGDFNDGIARDIVDDTYLLHSIVHELRGAFHHELALMRHVLTPKELQKKSYAWTAEFRDPTNRGKNTRVLLDHILFSPRCHEGGVIRFVRGSARVERKAYNRHVKARGDTRDDRPSDHVPLSAKFLLV